MRILTTLLLACLMLFNVNTFARELPPITPVARNASTAPDEWPKTKADPPAASIIASRSSISRCTA